MRRGFPSQYQINVKNKGLASSSNCILKATIPSYVQIDSADVDWISSEVIGSNTVITWNLGVLNYSDDKMIKLHFVVPISVDLGRSIESLFSIQNTSNECNILNNNFVDIQTVVGSVDPNDILAYPSGDTENHYINRKQDITYRIRFQNVGNYEAEFVNVIDELPAGIDINSISNITSSHRYEMTTEGNKLHFYFPNINLPDSTTDLEGSNGFIQFTVSQNSNVENGDIIENKAYIQFDYNEYIITNTVFHTIIVNENGDNKGTLILFPNPANEYAFARINIDEDINPEIKLISVYDLLGSQVYSEECKANVMKLEVAHLPIGNYMVSATDIYGKVYTGKLIISRQ
jgi:fimbrial isopeptide formation D2 family protein